MAYKRLNQQIAETKLDDTKTLDSMAAAILEKSLREPREVVGSVHSEDLDIRATASSLLLRLGNLVVTPMLDSIDDDIPEDYVWDMQTATKLHLETRSRIVKILEKMLADTRPVQVGNPFAFREQKPTPRRICDEAFLLLRQLTAIAESEEERTFNEEAFLGMEDQERDSEIRRFLQTKIWRSLIETSSEE